MDAASSWDVFSIAIEAQRLVECNGFRPIPLDTLYEQLSGNSRKLLETHSLTLLEALESHPRVVACGFQGICPTVSSPGSPWLGPTAEPPAAHGPPGPRRETLMVPEAIHRGQAIAYMGQIADTQQSQMYLREVATHLLEAENRTLLVSMLGTLLSQESKTFLKGIKLRTSQIVRCFPEDFDVENSGSASRVTYKHAACKPHFVPVQQYLLIDSIRYGRLLKLCADTTAHFGESVNGISASEMEKQLRIGECLLVDCRSEAERRVGGLKGAVAKEDVTMLEMESCRMIFAYCAIGYCAAAWCREIATGTSASLASKCFFLLGGIAAWAHQGGLFHKPGSDELTRQVHGCTLVLEQIFPSKGYEFTYSPISFLQQHSLMDGFSCASLLRCQRLHNLAWEVRLRYCPSVFTFEAVDLLRRPCGKDELIMIDCRTEEERQVSTLATSCRMFTKEQFMERFREISTEPCVLVAFCTIGGRSGKFCESLLLKLKCEDAGSSCRAPQVRSIHGGMCAWLHEGGGLVDSGGMPTRRMHPWTLAFLDLFPVEGLQLVCDELQTTPLDAQPFVCCLQDYSPAHYSNLPLEVFRACRELAPEALADTLRCAAKKVPYED
mmetsp:Transcript_2860/g.7272  ORF Transcript_2860/g.7272 Transcript_2860/m.7272 type:complete len:609 (-) Transcript_2860:237-2063(-)